ncbi:fatty acid desaturase family protein [Pedobacter sandarakinus]|uniref:fatty acid desaturase family protein n=1 Tax=Pedobacter sandarakinus TaxID=353156 RepID=UPI002245A606|nr:acyl-CoA desaturase [Pedobacter sandarakinus]MCX2574958.1 acyl-CoA desaturase [Pedobacter sandarakinus]
MKTKTKFPTPQGANFYAELRRRVNDDFAERKISVNATGLMWLKTIIFLSLFTTIYLLILLSSFNLLTLIMLTLLLGIVSAFIGFNVCHDAIHGSFSSSKATNKVLSMFFHLVGASPYVWNITHNVVHHTYTNIPGHDEDIEIAPGLIRISPEDELRPHQRFQHWYAFPMYGLASLSWVLRKDFKKFFQKRIGARENSHPKIEYFNLFFYKSIYYCLFIVFPIVFMEIAWWQALTGFILLHLAQGITMGLVFQLAHVVEGTSFPTPNEHGNMEEAWAEHQMRTTANFATQCPIAAFFLGGLNRQIEHHLFPKVCHIHYGRISVIVKETALEFGIPYHENKTFSSALASHYRMLKKMGRPAVL